MTDVLATTRCPQCVALVRPGQPWCTLCHADLRPAPEPVAEVPQTAPPVPLTSAALTSGLPPTAASDPLTDPLTDPLVAAPGAALGKHARHAAGADAPAADPAGAVQSGPSEREIELMLAQLAAQTEPPLGGLGRRFESRGAKVGLAAGVGLAAIGLLLLGAVVLTAIFG